MSGLSALIVDDSEADRLFAKIQLNRFGAFSHIHEARTGLEAIQLFQNDRETREKQGEAFPPSVLFLDINMPVMNGFEFLEQLVDIPDDLQPTVVVMVTSSDLESDRQRAEQFKAVKAYVTKPLTQGKLNALRDTLPQK